MLMFNPGILMKIKINQKVPFLYRQRKQAIWMLLATFMVTAPVSGEAGTCKGVKTSDVGYPDHRVPTPNSCECLIPQAIIGGTGTVFTDSAVEAGIAVNPKDPNYIVSCWQQGRFSNGGGSLEIGIAYTSNGGKSWNRTTVPFQYCNGGLNQRVTNAWLSYSKDGKKLYLAAVLFNTNFIEGVTAQSGVVITTSVDNGKNWDVPRFVATSFDVLNETVFIFPLDDKTSVTADPNDSRFAYIVWDRLPNPLSGHSDTLISRTLNKGLTFQPPQLVYNPSADPGLVPISNNIANNQQTITNVVVVLPDNPPRDCQNQEDFNILSSVNRRFSGDLLNFMVRIYARPGTTEDEYLSENNLTVFPQQFVLYDIATVRSIDKGANWDIVANVVTPLPQANVYTGGYTFNNLGQITGGIGSLLRSYSAIPAYTVNPRNGFLYVVFTSNQLTPNQLPQIALVTSRDGGFTWSEPVLISRTPQNSPNPQAFSPFVAVTEEGDVGILYFDFRNDNKCNPDQTNTDAWLAIYKEVSNPNGGDTGIGLEFVKEARLSKESYIAQNAPLTNLGLQLEGDSPFLVAQHGKFYASYIKTFDGPFAPAVPIVNEGDTVLLLDDNKRSNPFVSIVKP